MLIGLAVLAMLMALAVPAFSRWLVDMRVRNQAEYVLSAVRLARGEALKRNTTVRFQLVSDLTNGCTVIGSAAATATNSNLWIISHGNPAANCANAEDLLNTDTTFNNPNSLAPVLLIKGYSEQQKTAQTTISGSADGAVCFAGTGALTRTLTATNQCSISMNPATTTAATITFDISDPSTGTCFTDDPVPPVGFAANGTVRCQRIVVSSWGDVRLCDPGLFPAKHPSDPRVCS
ncbi:MAG TPA: hypothetical protein VJ001_17165 [Rhodocyclaceae bacterium]|nr:hypothetical protein [Rhodocyclaceae bacterium]